jgi:beta-glucosidase
LTNTKINYAIGYKSTTSTDTSYFADALSIASNSDKVLMFVGEENNLSGESNCRSNINLPGVQ